MTIFNWNAQEEIKNRERERRFREEENRERIRKKTEAYNNMNYYSSSPEQKKMYEILWKSL